MIPKIKILSVPIIIGLISILAACSSDKSSGPVSPPTPSQGRVLIENGSEAGIFLVSFTQTRGQRHLDAQLGIRLFAGQSFYLHNILDPEGGQLFPGGDKVSVRYVSEQPNPDDPTQPLFDNTVVLTINGSYVIQVKSGGHYSISPE